MTEIKINIKTKKSYAVAELTIEIDDKGKKLYSISNFYTVGSQTYIGSAYKKTNLKKEELKNELVKEAAFFFKKEITSGIATKTQKQARAEMLEILKPTLFGSKAIKFNEQSSLT